MKSYKSKSRNFRENRSLLCDKLGWLPIASQKFSQPHSSSSSFTKLAQRIKWSKSFFVDTSTSQKCLEAVSPIDTPRRKHDPKSFGAQKWTSQHRTFILQNNSSRLIGETWVIAFRRGAKRTRGCFIISMMESACFMFPSAERYWLLFFPLHMNISWAQKGIWHKMWKAAPFFLFHLHLFFI